ANGESNDSGGQSNRAWVQRISEKMGISLANLILSMPYPYRHSGLFVGILANSVIFRHSFTP
uniref:hypothetical protein n=1 Tax=Vibrio crassostreae TaxID=246167 RepID=UPI001B30D1CB